MVRLPGARRRENPEGRMSVLDHLRELRRRIITMVLLISAGAVLGYLLYPHTLEILKRPYCAIDYHYRLGALNQSASECRLQYRGVLDGFTIRLKVSFVSGAIFTAPLWLYQIWAFITPGLRKNEKRYTITFIGVSTLLFAAGMAMAYVTLPTTIRVLVLTAGPGTQAAYQVTDYISFVILMLTVFGASFELPLLIVMLNLARILPYKILKRGQRIAIFLIFLFAAVATPSTDPFTMLLFAIPMCVLFEAAVLWTFVYDRRRARRATKEEADRLPDDVASPVDPIPQALPPAPADDVWTELP